MYEQYVADAVHEPTQSSEAGFDLTVAAIHEVVEPGRVDFGGGELEPAGLARRDTELQDPDDDYGWWTLRAGQYLLEYNESLRGDAKLTVQPRDALLERGASHPTARVADLGRVPLTVGGAGIRIKENARVSTVVDAVETES